MNTEKQLQFVTPKQAEQLKNLGFDCKVDSHYSRHDVLIKTNIDDNWNSTDLFISAPTIALALKWCRDVKDIPNGIRPKRIASSISFCWWYSIDGDLTSTNDHQDYEVAESTLLDKILLELKVKN